MGSWLLFLAHLHTRWRSCCDASSMRYVLARRWRVMLVCKNWNVSSFLEPFFPVKKYGIVQMSSGGREIYTPCGVWSWWVFLPQNFRIFPFHVCSFSGLLWYGMVFELPCQFQVLDLGCCMLFCLTCATVLLCYIVDLMKYVVGALYLINYACEDGTSKRS